MCNSGLHLLWDEYKKNYIKVKHYFKFKYIYDKTVE